MFTFIIWLILRISTSLISGFVSSIRPFTALEISIPIFPPSSPFILWLQRVFVSPWMRWDALWYRRIVVNGYSATDGTAQFHPLFPWLAKVVTIVGASPDLSLLIISSIASMGLLFIFLKFAQIDLERKNAIFSLLLFAFAPAGFILFAPYSESLFLLFAVLCLLFSRKRAWWIAGLFGGLASLTRQQGIFLIFPLAWELWDGSKYEWRLLLKHWKDNLSLLLVPFGMLVWILYRALFINDFYLHSGGLHDFIYSFLISPSATEVVPNQNFVWPWQALYYAWNKIIMQPDLDIWVNITTGFLFIILLVIAWKGLRTSYKLYVVIIALVSFCYYTGPIHPYMGLTRHLYLAFPIYISLASVIKRPWLRVLVVGFSSAGMFFLEGLYVLRAWIP